jgi:RsiW-degrading membrane proteinase PrsW (M82 family)
VLAGIAVGFALQVAAARMPMGGRRAAALTWASLAALLGPFALIPLTVFGEYPAIAIACVPSSAFVLWLLHHSQRFARLPASMLLAAFGWGALITYGFTRACSGLAMGVINAYLAKNAGTDLGAILEVQYHVIDFLVLHLTIVCQLTFAAGVVLLLMLFRHRITDVVTGLVLGAAIGLGYNFSESILFIKLFGSLGFINGATGGFEYWIRQSVSILAGPVVFGALLGAGLGVAAQAQQRRQSMRIAGASLLAAIGGAAATETLSAWFSHLVHETVGVGGALDTLVISPFFWLLVQIPFLVLCALLLRSGLRTRAAAARAAVSAEAAAGSAITEAEVPFLVDPALRFWALVGTWRRHGRAAAWALNRLQSAQLDVAGWRWQRQQQQRANSADDPTGDEEGENLRAKVIQSRAAAGRWTAPR